MYKQLIAHKNYIENHTHGNLSESEKKKLLRYHVMRVRDFQHERLIHLLVTFFFALLFLGSFVLWLFLPQPDLFVLLTLLTCILFILELAYIRHYYQLENGVQSLYRLTEQLRDI